MASSSNKKKSSSGKSNLLPIALSLGALLIAAAGIWYGTADMRPRSAPPSPGYYYYDTAAGQIFINPALALPPIAPPGAAPDAQPASFMAFVYSCSSCQDKSSLQAGWIKSFNPGKIKTLKEQQPTLPEARIPDFLEDNDPGAILIVDPAKLSAAKGKSPWVAFNSREGQALIAKTRTACPDKNAYRECYPTR